MAALERGCSRAGVDLTVYCGEDRSIVTVCLSDYFLVLAKVIKVERGVKETHVLAKAREDAAEAGSALVAGRVERRAHGDGVVSG